MTFGFFLLSAGLVALLAGIKGQSISDTLKGVTGGSFWDTVKGATSSVVGAQGGASDTDAPAGPAGPLGEEGGVGSGRIYELFYDPLGAWKNGIRIPAIGGHDDHVHVAAPTGLAKHLQSIATSRFNLTIEEPVGHDSGGHVANSYHKRNQAFDASGSANDMHRFAEYVRDDYVHKSRRRTRTHGTRARSER